MKVAGSPFWAVAVYGGKVPCRAVAACWGWAPARAAVVREPVDLDGIAEGLLAVWLSGFGLAAGASQKAVVGF